MDSNRMELEARRSYLTGVLDELKDLYDLLDHDLTPDEFELIQKRCQELGVEDER